MTVCALCRKIMPGEFDPTEIVLCHECIQMFKRQYDNGWIMVQDRLPENEDRVLCCTRTAKGQQNIVIGYYMGGSCRCGMNSNVTHWMPLPRLP